MKTKEIGQEGEDLVVQYLLEKGFTLVQRNYRYKKSEIDIIVKKDNRICFVEVKKRKNKYFGYPESFVTTHQKERIHKAAENFIRENRWYGNIRFDIASVLENNIDYFEDAF